MSVIFYDKDEHGAGFIGFRVSRIIGSNTNPKQEYYPLSKHSYEDAYALAHKKDKEWMLEAEEVKKQDRINAKKIKAGPAIDSIKSLAEVALMAKEVGIRSTSQLSVFLMCASQEGNCLFDIFGLPLDSKEYKRVYGTVHQLMLGSAARDYDGANLLTWGDIVYGSERAVVLTAGGYMFFSKVKKKIGLK